MQQYIDLRHKPNLSNVIAEYYLEPNKISLQKAANHVAGESSIDTWSDIKTLSPSIIKKLRPYVFSINTKQKIIKIEYPVELFEKGNIPQILSSLAGNIFGMKAVNNLRLLDIHFPKKIIKSFKGPKYGIKGIRKLTRIKNRPLIGTIIKPKLGLNHEKHAQVAYQAWLGGVDAVKDDENLTSMGFNNFKKRMDITLKMKELAEKETGEVKIYMPNISAETTEMLRRMEYVQKNKGNYIMVDILTTGFSALQTIRNKTKLPIHAHRAMHAALTKNKKHGISMLVLAKIARLIGVDTLHIGTAFIGKMSESKDEVITTEKEIENRYIKNNREILEQNWFNIKPVMAVASGGLCPTQLPKLVKTMGKNVVYNFGGGIHAHPQGTYSGAKSARQALEAVMKNKTLKQYAKTHPELQAALKKWPA